MPAPKRRRWFSLSLLIGVTLLNVLFGGLLLDRGDKLILTHSLEVT